MMVEEMRHPSLMLISAGVLNERFGVLAALLVEAKDEIPIKDGAARRAIMTSKNGNGRQI